ncbi:MAG: antibiotic biosynthesis monooxygenase, partial [Myxococcota bacterium]
AENARHSRKEPGIATFELLQADEDPTSFLLVETYRAAADQAKHKETDHFHRWVKTVESMMAEPRRAVKYTLPLPPA